MEEEVDIVDEKGIVIHVSLKSQAHKHGLLHKAVIGYIKQGDKWSLIRQAADRQDPGQLVAPIGGHVRAGEDNITALYREAEEEIGTRDIQHKFIGTACLRRPVIGRDENHLFIVYVLNVNGKIKLGSEADSIETYDDKRLKQMIANSPGEFGEAFYFSSEHFFPELLPNNYNWRWKVE